MKWFIALILSFLMFDAVLGLDGNLSLNVLSPGEGLIVRGSKVLLSVKLNRGADLISNASVTVALPNGSYVRLPEASKGVYSMDYDVGFNDSLGLWNVRFVGLTPESVGSSSVNVTVTSALINLSLLSPARSSFSVGEDVDVIIKAAYPNGEPVVVPELVVLVSGNNLSLKSNGFGVYSGVYSVTDKDNDVLIEASLTDVAGNSGSATFPIAVSGVIWFYYFKAYPLIAWPLVVVCAGLIILFIVLRTRKFESKDIKSCTDNILSLKKKAQEDYFVKHTISKKKYDELMVKYDSIMCKIKSERKIKQNNNED